MSKVILVSIDGMRPDGAIECKNEFVQELMKKSSYTLNAQTVFPSITLPCHLSMFHSIPPQRHGTLSNDYVVPVRPVDGLFEVLKNAGKANSMFYGWEHLRNIGKAGSLVRGEFIGAYTFEHTDKMLADSAIDYIKTAKPDFVFLYMVETDDKGGHDVGWMSDVYLDYVSRALDNVKNVMEAAGDEYTIIVTADHGGHDRSHGSEMPEDMTIPMFFCGEKFKKGEELENVSILDIAPTIADIMGVAVPREWEGKSLINL